MASNRFFLHDGSSSSEESSDDEQQVQVQPSKKGSSKSATKSYVFPIYIYHQLISYFSAPKPYLAMSDDEEDVKRVVRSEKEKRYNDSQYILMNEDLIFF
jgi:hypothetical protein